MLTAMACLMSMPHSVKAGINTTPPPMPLMAPTRPAATEIKNSQWNAIDPPRPSRDCTQLAVGGPIGLTTSTSEMENESLAYASEAEALEFFPIDRQAVLAVAQPAMGLGVDRVIDDSDRAVAEGHVKADAVGLPNSYHGPIAGRVWQGRKPDHGVAVVGARPTRHIAVVAHQGGLVVGGVLAGDHKLRDRGIFSPKR